MGNTGNIRNVGIVAHVDAGKTTTTEQILVLAGVVRRAGHVDDGTAFTDWMKQEQQRGISITAAIATLTWQETRIHLVDTPGHVDFSIEVERSLRALDGVVAVFCARHGVEPQSEAVWHQAVRNGRPRLAFVNKMDVQGADINMVLTALRDRLGAYPVLIQHVEYEQGIFQGVVSLLNTPNTPTQSWLDARSQLIERVAEDDDELMVGYVEGRQISDAALVAALSRSTQVGRVVPVLCGVAKRGIGIRDLLDAMVVLLPPSQGHADVPLRALVFKTGRPFGERICYVRVFDGALTAQAQLFNLRTKQPISIDAIFDVHGRDIQSAAVLPCGAIGAVQADGLATGDTLAAAADAAPLPTIACPEPVLSVAVTPKHEDSLPQLSRAIEELVADDPSLRVGVDPETGVALLFGLGELHLEIVAARLQDEYGLQCEFGRPAVAYRLCIQKIASRQVTIHRSLGGRSEYGDVTLRLTPRPEGSGNSIVWLAGTEQVPNAIVEAVHSGVTEALDRADPQGAPTTDVLTEICSVGYHPVESAVACYKIAAMNATLEAIHEADPTVMEPVMALEVSTPDAWLGEVIADLHTRRGKISGITAQGGVQNCACYVPMASLFGYSNDLRSRTQGRASYTMRFDHYQPIPKQLRELVARR